MSKRRYSEIPPSNVAMPSWLGAGEYDEMCRAEMQAPSSAMDVEVKLAEKEAPLAPVREFEATGGSPPGVVQTQVHCLSSGSGHMLQLVNHAESLQLLQPSINYTHTPCSHLYLYN